MKSLKSLSATEVRRHSGALSITLFIYLFICSNMIEHKTILLKQLHEQDNKAVINSADSCPNYYS